MAKVWSYFLFLLWISYLMTIALLLFTEGFLLNKVARTEKGECIPCRDSVYCTKESIFQDQQTSASLCMEPRAKIVLLVVDALKYDFVKWNKRDTSPSYYKNKMPIVNELLMKYPQHTRLYKFVADPPTTTMQRLKSITTGTLPTFVDIGSNFNAENINEDNLVEQNSHNGVVFMGDDTWIKLFPGKFLRQYPAPSFNVWDLDTVDQEVEKRMFPELKEKDWKLLVAHTLGIDHCGHKHGPNHSEMTRKLNETNDLIKRIVENLEEDSILMVIGDHGMTETGDHGGSSSSEIDAAMFVYSKIPLIDRFLGSSSAIVNQIDLVPTLAAILGTPVPFSNLGTVILDSLPKYSNNSSFDHLEYAVHSLWRNIAQTKKYIDVYSSDTYLFSDEKLREFDSQYNHLLDLLENINQREEYEAFIVEGKEYLRVLRDTCIEIWVQFDSGLMSKGLVLMFCALFFFYMFVNGLPENNLNKVINSSFLRYTIYANFAFILILSGFFGMNFIADLKNSAFFGTGSVSIAFLAILVVQNWDVISAKWYNTRNQKAKYFVRIILLLTLCGVFSNSYVINENKVLSFLLCTLVCMMLYSVRAECTLDNMEKKSKFISRTMPKTAFWTIILSLGFAGCLAVRLSNYFWRCRDDIQDDSSLCSTYVMGKSGSIDSKNFERFLLVAALIVLALYITIVRIWMRNCGNLVGFAPSVIFAQYCPGVIVVFMGCYWVLRLPKDVKVKFVLSWQINALPTMIYFLLILGIFIYFYRPLTIYVLPKRKESIDVYGGENVVPRLFEKMKDMIYRKKANDNEDLPIVYGLGTIYSATIIMFSMFFMLLHALLLGYALAPSIFAIFVTCISILGITGINRYRNANNIDEMLRVPDSVLLCWFLTAEYFFYGTGHQPSFPTIHWDAAFVGVDDNNNLIQAALVGINTFGSYIILGVSVPLLVIVPFTFGIMFPNVAKPKFKLEDGTKKGELLLYERDSAFQSSIFTVCGKYILFHGMRTFGCMLAATIHCRHLMVWSIFAPKLIFEGIGFLVTLGSVLASVLLLIRVDSCVERLVAQVTKSR
ncbi:GPI ethanolamine phosphate transferase 3 [Leptopilina heterotoma]|uniref:GPI ethanolamine phosphate transferase 3 n=1 Tax=Leptopilina heterotoma TaxID=63436 RepID=UPI001CA8F010|nr:GPI ethanolamine phosphate transferase 3 [Leptopilina heterotoma]